MGYYEKLNDLRNEVTKIEDEGEDVIDLMQAVEDLDSEVNDIFDDTDNEAYEAKEEVDTLERKVWELEDEVIDTQESFITVIGNNGFEFKGDLVQMYDIIDYIKANHK